MVNGTIIEKTDIAVDFWRVRKYPWLRHFFLSHVHSDHTEGLSPSWRQTIYCSEMSKKLLMHKIGVNECLIEAIEIGSPKLITGKRGRFTVTLIDANHCPGSVMFLFEGDFGRVLYTADFRCDAKFFQYFQTLPIGSIDTLYLDNTYFLEGANFPTREEATMQVVKVIEEHPRHRIVIICYSIGKEDLLVNIALHFKEWIVVSMERYRVLEILGVPNVFTTEEKAGRIRVIVAKDLKNRVMQTWIRSRPTVAIFPTGMFNHDNNPYRSQSWEKSFFIPYSDHSSFQELQDFLSYVKPDKIVPIIKGEKTKFLKETNYVSKQLLAINIRIEADPILEVDSYKGFCEYAAPMKRAPAATLKRKKHRPNRRRTASFKVATQRKGVVFDDDRETEVIAQEEMTLGKSEGNEVTQQANTETLHIVDQAPTNSLHFANQYHTDTLNDTVQSLSEALNFTDCAPTDSIQADQATINAISATDFINTRRRIGDVQSNQVEQDANIFQIDDMNEDADWNCIDSDAHCSGLQLFESVNNQNSVTSISIKDAIDHACNDSLFSKHSCPASSKAKRKMRYESRHQTDILTVADEATIDAIHTTDNISTGRIIGDTWSNQVEQDGDIYHIDDADEDAGRNSVDSNEDCCGLQSFSCKRMNGFSLEDMLDYSSEQDTDVCQIDDTNEDVDWNGEDTNELKSSCSGSKSSNSESINSQNYIGNFSLKDVIDYIYNDSVFSKHASSASSNARRKKSYEDKCKILSTASAAALEVLSSKSSPHWKT